MIDRFVEQDAIPSEYSDAVRQLLAHIHQYMAPPDIDRVMQALQLAQETCQGVTGNRTLPPLEHALAVATILAQMHIDAVGVAAGLVFEAVDANLLALERVEQILGTTTARIVGSMERLNILERKKQSAQNGRAHDEREDVFSNLAAENKKPRIREALRRQQAETVRKMFIGMAEDPRVVLLKLAYRLHAMHIICRPDYQGDPQEMQSLAEETREIYAPLAGRLGMSRVESELQDLAFQVLEPDKFAWVRNLVEAESKQWRSYVERVCDTLRAEMKTLGLKAEVSGRVKHAYSFYKKLQRHAGEVEELEALKEALDINQIHDLLAFRILVESTPDCYVVLGHVHSLWKPKEGRIKDFIANPKPNGYSALHTTVFCLDDQLVEIQIRTFAMHEMAEYGVAMHWHYKDVGDNASASAKELLTWLRQLAEWQRDIHTTNSSDTDFMQAVKDDIFQEQIFVFTPKGEVKDLPVGSTPLDFAYRIHSKIGDACAGARIITQVGDNESERLVTRMVPLDYELKSGDIVDIVTSRTAHPTRDWLTLARTAAARSKIRRYLKTHERHINIQIGSERLDRELKMTGAARGTEGITEDAEKWLCDEFHREDFEDILAALGVDQIRPRSIVNKLNEYWQQREGRETRDNKEGEKSLVLPTTTARQNTPAQLKVAGVQGLLTKLANCCCPLPNDDIVGFVSRGKGVIVHRADCRNLARYYEKDRERLINVSWMSMDQLRYVAPIVITARDRPGLIRDIAAIFSELSINLLSIKSHLQKSRATVVITATLEIDNLGQLERLFSKIERLKEIIRVERNLGNRA